MSRNRKTSCTSQGPQKCSRNMQMQKAVEPIHPKLQKTQSQEKHPFNKITVVGSLLTLPLGTLLGTPRDPYRILFCRAENSDPLHNGNELDI